MAKKILVGLLLAAAVTGTGGGIGGARQHPHRYSARAGLATSMNSARTLPTGSCTALLKVTGSGAAMP